MYFIRIESFVFSDLSHSTNTLPVLYKCYFVLWLELQAVLKAAEASLSSWRCKIDTREGNHCH